MEDIIKQLINGETVSIKDEAMRKAIQKKLRSIKNNCTLVLRQLKES